MASRRIYLLSPRQLSPETIAVAFAKTSRSPESFQEIANGLSEASSAKFHERWVIGYGHASVAEHAVLHIAIENVSRLAVECIESNRLASYTEKSTRYQKWRLDDFLIPPELEGHPYLEIYQETCRSLFDTYSRSLAPLRANVEPRFPRLVDETEAAYDRRIRSQYIDSCRFLLPAASLANLGMTANARVLERAISKMLSHPLMEVRKIGEELKETVQEEVPTLCKYAGPLPAQADVADLFHPTNQEDITPGKEDWCRLVHYDPDGEDKVLAAILYHAGGISYDQALKSMRGTRPEQKAVIAERSLAGLSDHETPPRELEHTSYTFDLILDQGGYGEFKRHRMMTQTPQPLTARLGYAVPLQVVEAGFEQPYRTAMDMVVDAYEKLYEWHPQAASYIVPNGFNRRVFFTMNLREAFAFCRLRSAANAHYSMRRAAQRIAGEIRSVHPLLAKFISLPPETWQEIEAHNFQSTR